MHTDLVITYVDNTDPMWQNQISQYNTVINDKRYRNWNNLSYLLEFVERNMPFIKKVHLVVAYESQVPEWIDRNRVHVVYHRDIIPEKYLPTFNSTTIEMFICRIEGLSERFIYANDDMFPLKPLDETDFFVDGKPVYDLVWKCTRRNSFNMQCYNSHRLACKVLGIVPEGSEYFYIRHSMDPMLKSSCEQVWKQAGNVILDSVTRFREPFNFTQYLFPDYDVLRGNSVMQSYDFKYFLMEDENVVKEGILGNTHKIVCLNDSARCERFEQIRQAVIDSFDCLLKQ